MRKQLSLHLPIALFFLIFSLFGTWYEGSNILENSFEWGDSAPFSTLFHGPLTSEADIMQVDFFVYASKFYPFFPTVLLLSVLYLLTVLGVCTIEDRRRRSLFFRIYTVCLLVVLAAVQLQHVDTKYYYTSCLFIGIGVNCLLSVRNNRRLSAKKDRDKSN